MTPDEIQVFKTEVREEVGKQIILSLEGVKAGLESVKSSIGLMKWNIGIVITLIVTFVGLTITNIIKQNNYITKEEFKANNIEIAVREDEREKKLKSDITLSYGFPIRLMVIQQKQIQAKLIDKDWRKYKLAKEEEERLNIENLKADCDLTTRGSK